MDKVNMFLSARPNAPKDAQKQLYSLLGSFVSSNENPMTSPNFQMQGGDEMHHLVKMARHPAVEDNPELTLMVLKVFKILSRKQNNREQFGERGIRAVLRFMQTPRNAKIAAEGSNVILNVCYEKDNVKLVLRCGGAPPLVTFLQSSDLDLQANAAGAIQSISFQEEGRVQCRECDAIPHVLALLATDNDKVKTRAVGAIHNMSSDAETIRIIRRQEGIPLLIDLLHSPNSAICGSAAGALQNVSREVASRCIIRDGGAVQPLSLILVGSDMQAQVCAAGALLNILGPDVGEEKDDKSRKGLTKLITCCILLGICYEGIFELNAREELMA
eukprot:CAMPEP_0114249152 /NCGR_PEP_ID=MMETSP0058-20121206/13980_1 /TAXON_ID=36894 /ORGANISM="Pyramimonas parkeae, CCMP726" /LENGTH=329 /DNA_ID=CAMNT_0001362659 /DNA_START=492 /DNA_END=1481 /DNA_ORIENTATION=+